MTPIKPILSLISLMYIKYSHIGLIQVITNSLFLPKITFKSKLPYMPRYTYFDWSLSSTFSDQNAIYILFFPIRNTSRPYYPEVLIQFFSKRKININGWYEDRVFCTLCRINFRSPCFQYCRCLFSPQNQIFVLLIFTIPRYQYTVLWLTLFSKLLGTSTYRFPSLLWESKKKVDVRKN
jgi:hypothetical protein